MYQNLTNTNRHLSFFIKLSVVNTFVHTTIFLSQYTVGACHLNNRKIEVQKRHRFIPRFKI